MTGRTPYHGMQRSGGQRTAEQRCLCERGGGSPSFSAIFRLTNLGLLRARDGRCAVHTWARPVGLAQLGSRRGPGVVTKLDVTQPNLNKSSVYNFEIASLNCVTTIKTTIN